MRPGLTAILALAGAVPSTLGVVNTRMEYQVSPALAEQWSPSIAAVPGQSVDVRVRISYIGDQSPIGFGSVNYQPTISNWDSAGAARDTFTPVANGYGDGNPSLTPPGWVLDSPGQYGRIFTFARLGFAPSDTQHQTVGMVNLHNGVNYLRIAQAYVTVWQAGATPNGGGGGVDNTQSPVEFRPTTAPPFDHRTQDIVIFKFNIVLSADAVARDLVADTPYELFGLYDSATGERQAHWIATTSEPTGTIRGTVQTIPATIHVVPEPGFLSLWAAALLVRRRRRTQRR